MNEFWSPIWLTARLAASTTLILLLIGIPLAWWLSRIRSWIKIPINSMIALPLVLPPSVIGFYLLLWMGPHGWLGQTTDFLGLKTLAFTFEGLLIGSIFYSLPFVIQPLQNAFESIDAHVLEAAYSLGARPFDRFINVVLPISKSSILTAAVFGFAHTVGEFGVVLMIGGNIPNQTQVISIKVYEHVESLEYAQAHTLALGLLIFSFAVLLLLNALNRTRTWMLQK